ncbi:MAG: UDP-N-acetylmuramate dehydrogenase [Vicinamibacteria bacterium]
MSGLANGTSSLARELRDARIDFRLDEPLARHTTMGLGGPADVLARPASVAEMVNLLALAREADLPVRVIGAGSNLLIDDAGVRGVVIATGALEGVHFPAEGIVEAGAGAHFPTLVRQTAARGLRGLEAGVGIPGSLGGILTMNAGAYQFSIGPLVREVEAVSPEKGRVFLHEKQIDFWYRASSFGANLIVARAKLSLTSDDPVAIKRDMNGHMRFRKETQPVGVKSAGCIFKNPAGDSAGRLIDRAGLKGFSVGGARVSEVHANFIVHEGRARTKDVLALIEAVREKVLRETTVLLETEVMTWSP